MGASVELLAEIPELEPWRERLAGLGVHAIGLVSSAIGTTTAGIHLAWDDSGSHFGWVLAERPTAVEARQAAIALLAGFAQVQDQVASDFRPIPHPSRANRARAIVELDHALHPFCGPPPDEAPDASVIQAAERFTDSPLGDDAASAPPDAKT